MTTPASPYLQPLVPDIRNLEGRARARGTTLDHEVSEYIQRETGGTRPDAIAKLDARQSKLEDQIAALENERAQQLGIAARFHSLAVDRDRLAAQLETARQKCGMHQAQAAEALLNAKLRLVVSGEAWQISGSLLAFHLEQSAVVAAMSPLIDELTATLTAAEEAVLSFGREHGITPTASPKS